ncbi:MAG: DEAD/DEAH box helicase, partial [Acidimicrobiales bacterium]|nr:DEAD/DEAH box helicase [Acidimicrobiales bacterium]
MLSRFSEPTRAWFTTTFAEPTPPQRHGWESISKGDHSLILAPTGSGKTLAAFLWAIDRLSIPQGADTSIEPGTKVLYVSPLRALAVDVDKNLRAPLRGIALAAERLGLEVRTPTVGVRTGDTGADERRALVRTPPDILITTPESLYLMLTSAARETLTGVEYVIIDEIHAVAGTKRGAHLSVSLERLVERCERPPQRIGLSATQRPLDEIARFLGGYDDDRSPRPVTVVDVGVRKELEVEVVVPVEDMGALGEPMDQPGAPPGAAQRRSIWPAMHPRLLDAIEQHRTTLVFVNARRLAERLAAQLNELAAERTARAAAAAGEDPPSGPVPELVRAHHGSLSRETRLELEDRLKQGELRGLVCTSSLELGIDMGTVDLVVQVESPRSVASGLQRIGRAGHQVGEPSRGRIFPKHRTDLLEAAVVTDRMRKGLIESTFFPRTPLDVLAQQIVAMSALDEWPVDQLAAVVRRSANFAELSEDVFENTLDLLAGRYPAEEFRELRPRIVWDRVAGVVRGRSGAQRLAVTNPGTIPDRGLFGVFLPDGTRVGELDEEMVYESRPGEVFVLGASTWRIEEITYERVIVTPAPGEPGRMPFWHGDGPGRPYELGRALGEFVRSLRASDSPLSRLRDEIGLDEFAAVNLQQFLADQAEATGAVPDDRTIVIERFPDEIGDWRVCILSPFGAQVHAPWGMVLRARLAERFGSDVELMWSDDGIVLRLPEAIDELPLDELLVDPDEAEDLLIATLPGTALFAGRFRECAARALLLPRRRPDQRTPLWQQRQRSADLLAVAGNYPDFPILLETIRECCNDVFDLPGLRQLLTDLRSRTVRTVTVDTPRASPFAQSLLFGWIAVYMYEADAPLAERRAAALALDRDLLRDLLGGDELRELLDAGVIADLEMELQRLADGRRARDEDEVHDLLRELGPLDTPGVLARSTSVVSEDALTRLELARRVIRVRLDVGERWAAAEDAARLRDALGVALPPGLPAAFTESVDRPVHDLVLRYAATHVPFRSVELAAWLGLDVARVEAVLADLETDGPLVRGEFRPDGIDREWCHEQVLRVLRRRSLARLRHEVEPVEAEALARFLPAWQGVGRQARGLDALVDTIAQLQGASLPMSNLEADVLAARVPDYRPAMLDELCTAGEVVWIGAGAVGARDGRVRLVFRDQVPVLVPPVPDAPDEPVHDALRDHLATRGASFWPDLVGAASAAGLPFDDESVLAALWDLVWAGEVTNDSLAPVRSWCGAAPRARAQRSRGRPRPGRLTRLGPPAAAGRWSSTTLLRSGTPSETAIAHARAMQLLERYGVLTRESALAEGIEGGFAGVYPVLRALEEQGRIRRGYFVEGLGAAQFALPGAVDRLRGARAADDAVVVLAATDPAQPYGAALAWPEVVAGRPTRSAGSLVV